MLIKRKEFIKPENDDATIWRYMDFTKFVEVLNSGCLHFTRIDKLGDACEGSFVLFNPPRVNEIHERNKGIVEPFSSLREEVKKYYANCWHINKGESAALWKLYLKSNEGVAIKSTIRTLADILDDCPESVAMSKVFYGHRNRDVSVNEIISPKITRMSSVNTIHAITTKRLCFEHENELRILVTELWNKNGLSFTPDDEGVKIHLDLNKLIKEVYVSPDAPQWFVSLTKDVANKYGLTSNIIKSPLRDKPIW